MSDLGDALEGGDLALLGCGKMGSALLAGWLGAKAPGPSIHVVEPAPSESLRSHVARDGVKLGLDDVVKPVVLVLAVKPQMMADATPQVAPLAARGALVVSIAAGTTIADIKRVFGAEAPVLRAMPNTPAAIGRGVSALYASPETNDDQRRLGALLMAAVGETVWLEDEAQMDAVTALSGSGPAYVFHMIEAMAAAGEAEGLPAELAMRLARATVSGAGELARQSDEAAAQLRANVTSPGGTTAAGLSELMADPGGLKALMRRTVAAAARRGRELAG